MACFYQDGDGNQYTEISILEAFYKSNFPIGNLEIFSSEEIQESVRELILKKNVSGNDYSKSTAEDVSTFITKENPLLKTIPGLRYQTRLVPEYRLEDRAINAVNSKFEEGSDVLPLNQSDQRVDDLYELIKDKINPLYSDRSAQIKKILFDLYQDIDTEEISKDFGTLIHNLISDKVRNREDKISYERIIKFLNDPKYVEFIGSHDIKTWIYEINKVVKKVYDEIQKIGLPISELFFLYNDDTNREHLFSIRGKIDLVAIDSSGTAHIYDIKVSNGSYDNKTWDPVKLLRLDWQLAIYKQLLGQYVDVSKTQLNVLPINMGTWGDPKTLLFEGVKNRSVENSKNLVDGKIETAANYIIPRKIFGQYDPSKSDKFKDSLNRLLGSEYSVKLNRFEKTVDSLVELAENTQRKDGGQFWFYNDIDTENLPKGYIKKDTIEELKPLIELYISEYEKRKDKRIVDLKEAFKTAVTSNQRIKTSDEKFDNSVNKLLISYVDSTLWDVVEEFPESSELGLIILRNKNTGQINVISMTANTLQASSHIEGFNQGDLEYMKTLLFLNEYKEMLLPYGTNKIGEIIIYNADQKNQRQYYRATHTQFRKFTNLMTQKGFSEQELKLSLENNFVGVVNTALQNLDSFFKAWDNENQRRQMGEIFSGLMEGDLTLTKIIESQKQLYEMFPEYKEKKFSNEIDFTNKIDVLFALLHAVTVTYYKDDLDLDFQEISMFSLNGSDLKSLLAPLWTDSNPSHDSKGRRITGLFQGLRFTTPDWVPSNYLRTINKLIQSANTQIAKLLLHENEIITKHTLKYYDDINFSEAERLFVGETQSKYKNLWKHNGSEFDPAFITKNPYSETVDNAMTDHERDYLKNILFRINIYKLNLNEKEASSLNPLSLESITSNKKIAEAIENGDYFNMPLVRREEISRYGSIFKTAGQDMMDRLQPYRHEVMDFLDHRGLAADDLSELERSRMGFFEMYDTYSKHTPEFKSRMVGKHHVNYFEFNLDTIANRVAFNKIRKHVFDQVFPVVNSLVWYMKFKAGQSSDEILTQVEYIQDQVRLSAYGEHIIDPEFKDYTIVQGFVKRISTIAMLGFRPILMAKELTIGTFKNIALAATKIFGQDQFSMKSLLSAYTKMLTIDKKFSQEFNLIDRINHRYRLANMDANTIATKMQADRHGVMFRGLSRYMYASNTTPDYYNRLVLFLAKMIEEGSYEAHSLVDDHITYDATKDKRFEYYFQNRDKYKNTNGEYIPAKDDKKYNTQRRRYLLLVSQLNQDGELLGNKYTEADIVPDAYSEAERATFKTFTDMAYGYYDKDSQAQINNTWYGLTWMQFMQYWPGKMKMWFGKSASAEESALSTVKQAVDDNGNKLWRKTVEKEDGTYDISSTTEDTGDPVIEFTGTPFESLATSMMVTARQLATLDFDSIKDNPQRRAQVYFALHDGVLMYLMMMFFVMLFKSMGGESNDGFSKELAKFGTALSQKVGREQNIVENTFGALKTDPMWLSWARRFGRDMSSVFEGNKTVMEAVSRNVGAFEMFRDDILD